MKSYKLPADRTHVICATIALLAMIRPANAQQISFRPGGSDVAPRVGHDKMTSAAPRHHARQIAERKESVSDSSRGSEALELARRFAPVLKFDRDTWHLPMSAQRWFDRMLCGTQGGPSFADGAYQYEQCSDIDTSSHDYRFPNDREVWGNPPPFGGSHDSPKTKPAQAMVGVVDNEDHENPDYWWGTLGPQGGSNVPVYFKIAENPQNGALRIKYIWFFGYQAPCEWSMKYGIVGEDRNGEHVGDWEHVMITTTPDRTSVEAVSYYQHFGHYTLWAPDSGLRRQRGGFETEVGGYGSPALRPVVYPGRLSHGSYHDRKRFQNPPMLSLACSYFGDRRDPDGEEDWWFTDANLINLRDYSEPWMQAELAGPPAGATELWVWGPSVETCSLNLLGICFKHVKQAASGSHPTSVTEVEGGEDWCFDSCNNKGCKKDRWSDTTDQERANWEAWCDPDPQPARESTPIEASRVDEQSDCCAGRDARIFRSNPDGIVEALSLALADTLGMRIRTFNRAIDDEISPCEMADELGIDLSVIWQDTVHLRQAAIARMEADSVVTPEQADWVSELLTDAPDCTTER